MFLRSCRDALFLSLVFAATVRADDVLTVDAAVRSALAAGDVDAQIHRVEEARGRLQQRLTRPNPAVTYDRQDIFDSGAAPGFVQDLLKVEQLLPSRHVRRARRQAGEREIDSVTHEVDVTRRQKVRDVRRAFVRALEAQEVARIYRSARTRVKTAQDVVALRFKAGESSKYENVRVELADAQERDLETAARVDFSRALSELGAAMSTTLPADTVLSGHLPGALALPARTTVPAVEPGRPPGSASRPELALERSRINQARADEAVARAEIRPQVTVGAGYMHFDQTGLPDQNGYNAIVSVGLPIHDRRQGDIRAARARAAAAQRTLDATTARIQAEIAGAWSHLVAANERLVELLATQKGRVGEMIGIAETSYRAGLQSLLELLDAYRLERDFRIARVRAQAALLLALEEYALALGTTPDQLLPDLIHTKDNRHAEHPEG